MSLRRRLGLLAALVTVVGVILGVAVSAAVNRSSHAVAAEADRWSPASADVNALLADLGDQETGERGFVITGQTSYLAPYNAGRTAAPKDIATLSGLLDGDRTAENALSVVVSDIDRWHDLSADPEIAQRRLSAAAAQALVAAGTGKRLFDQLRADIDRLDTVIDQRRSASESAVKHANTSLRAWLWVTAGVALLVFGFVLFALTQWILRPVGALVAAMRRVSAGDLDANLTVAGPPEIARVSTEADGMRRRILDELERSEASRQALEQHGPVVLGLSQRLAPQINAPVPGLRYSAVLRPAEGLLAGDWVDVLPLDRNRVAFMLLDVSGHGAAAGLEAMRLKQVLTTALTFGHQPHEALASAAGGFAEDERFATAVIIVLDLVTGEIRWANAGHLAPRLVPLGMAVVEPDDLAMLAPTGPILSGITSGWTTRSARLEMGYLLLAFSDGLTEARDSQKSEFGIAGVCTALSQTTIRDVDTVVSVCLAAARAHATNIHRDDVTVLAVTRDPAGLGVVEPSQQVEGVDEQSVPDGS